jgi:hypothetical protein
MLQHIKSIIRNTRLYDLLNWLRYRIEFWQWVLGRLDRAPHVLKRMIVQKRARDYRLRTFVETGTLFGDMTYAMRNNFDQLVTIELDDYLYNRAVKRFKNYPRVKLLHGDSGVKIVEALASLHAPTLFWLDAHYSGGVTAHGEKMTPIFDEIRHILTQDVKGHVIVVDDARLFNGTDGYPTFREIQDFVTSINKDYLTWIENDTISIAKTY